MVSYGQRFAPRSSDCSLTQNGPEGDLLDRETVGMVVSVGTDMEPDVRRHLQDHAQKVKAVLLVRPTLNLDRHCLRGAVMAVADGLKEVTREFARLHGAKRMVLY
jgi:hypothetical protein